MGTLNIWYTVNFENASYLEPVYGSFDIIFRHCACAPDCLSEFEWGYRIRSVLWNADYTISIGFIYFCFFFYFSSSCSHCQRSCEIVVASWSFSSSHPPLQSLQVLFILQTSQPFQHFTPVLASTALLFRVLSSVCCFLTAYEWTSSDGLTCSLGAGPLFSVISALLRRRSSQFVSWEVHEYCPRPISVYNLFWDRISSDGPRLIVITVVVIDDRFLDKRCIFRRSYSRFIVASQPTATFVASNTVLQWMQPAQDDPFLVCSEVPRHISHSVKAVWTSCGSKGQLSAL